MGLSVVWSAMSKRRSFKEWRVANTAVPRLQKSQDKVRPSQVEEMMISISCAKAKTPGSE